MRLSKLHVTNFRGFAGLELAFHPEVTVLVGVNGAGKSSLLDAVALMLQFFTAGVRSDPGQASPLHARDVKVGTASARVELSADLCGVPSTWSSATTLPGFPADGIRVTDLSGLAGPIRLTQESIASGRPSLPLAVYYPTNRNALDIPERIRTAHVFDALSAYDLALERQPTDFRGFFEWFREEEDVFNEAQARRQLALPHAPEPTPSLLPHVRAAVEAMVPGGRNLRIERRPQRMVIDRDGVSLDITQLSDGEKCLLALAGDLARRMVLAAPFADKPLEQPAVVLIDEIELHLHPGLQRTILPSLRRVFPGVQFVVSTHSPQVLSSVRAESVRLLENFAIEPLSRATWQRDSNRILEAVFGDFGRPREVAQRLGELRVAVDEERWDEARRLVAELRDMIEGEDPDVFYLEQFLPPEDAAS